MSGENGYGYDQPPAYGGGYGGDYGGGYGGGGYGGSGQAAVHVNPYAYGAEDYGGSNRAGSASLSNNNRVRGASNLSSGTGRSRQRSKIDENDDAASDVEDPMQGSAIQDDVPAHYRNQTSGLGLDSTREIYKTNAENKGGSAPNEGLTCLCVIFALIFILVIVVLLCFDSNMMVIVGVFGDISTDDWNYGWDSAVRSFGPDDAYVDTYTRRIASDAGDLVLFGCLMSIVFVIIGFMLLCVRYSSNLPLYSSICCIRIPHRAFIYTILNTIELFTRRITIVYLILGIVGLIEMTYYVSFNCTSGECFAYIYPHYGWGILLVTTLMISLCGFTETRKLDPKLDEDNLNLYWPQHAEYQSRNFNTIDLAKLLKQMSNQRKIILNSIILICLQQSGLLCLGVITTSQSTDPDTNEVTEVDVALLQPLGWNVAEYYDNDGDDNTKASTWKNWGSSLRDMYSGSIVISFFSCLYLWLVLAKFKSFTVIKWFYIIIMVLLALSWLGVSVMFYYSYYEYYFNGTGESDIDLGPEQDQGIAFEKFWCPDWGVFILILNWVYMMQNAYYGWKGL